MSAKHISEHEDMIRLADGILGLVQHRDALDLGMLAQQRLSFARLVSRHCEDEGAMVRDAVRRGSLCPELVATFARQMVCWRADLATCNAEWPLSRICDDPGGFHRRFRPVVDALRDYIARENRDILAILPA